MSIFAGYSDTSPRFPSYLAPRTVINNRYVVGKVLSYNGESVTYIGYDVIGERKVHEYFPDTLVTAVKTENRLRSTTAVKFSSSVHERFYRNREKTFLVCGR